MKKSSPLRVENRIRDLAKTSKSSPSKKTTAGKKKRRGNKTSEILIYRDKNIVVDTASHFIFIGKLQEIGDYYMTLADVDVHDRNESPSMNEKYIMDSKKYGVRCNRRLVHVRLEEIISVSLLEDVIEY